MSLESKLKKEIPELWEHQQVVNLFVTFMSELDRVCSRINDLQQKVDVKINVEITPKT